MANSPKWPVFQIAKADGTLSGGVSPKWPVIQIADSNGNLTSLSGAGTFSVQDYGAKGDGVTDDTAAINAAITAAYNAGVANGTYYGEVYFPPAIYQLTGSLTQGGATKGNALIPLPVVVTTGQKFTLVLRGVVDGSALWHWQQTTAQVGGATLRTTVTGTNDGTYGEASVIGGPTPAQGYGQATTVFSNMLVVINGLNIVVPNDPHICGIDLRGVGEANVMTAAVLANANPSTVTAATQSWQFGLAMPQNNNNDSSTIGSYSAEGMNYGVYVDEHTVAHSIRCIYCVAGIEVCSSGGMSHGAQISYASVEACQVGIGAIGGGGVVWVDMLDWESGSGSFAPFATVNDPSNTLFGRINVTNPNGNSFLAAGTGGYTVRNAFNCPVYDLRRPTGIATAPGVPSSTTAFLNPFYRDAAVTISGGTVTVINVDGQSLGVTSGTVMLPTQKAITLTYSVAPSWHWTLL